MALPATPRPVVLIPATTQTLWGWPAVANFVAGGLGAGLYVTAALATPVTHPQTRLLAAWLGPALVLAGFAAVATEAGRPLRGAHVLARVRTSWMSRELWLGVAFALLAATEPVLAWPGQRALAGLAAVGVALAQGCILREARGIAAWAVPIMPGVFLSSALVSGAGLLLLLEAGLDGPATSLLGGSLVLLIVHALVWAAYLDGSDDTAFVAAVGGLRGSGGMRLTVGGVAAPSLALALAVTWPALALPLATAAGALMIAGQGWAKAALVRRAGQLRAITVPHLALDRRSR